LRHSSYASCSAGVIGVRFPSRGGWCLSGPFGCAIVTPVPDQRASGPAR
jgi:hypothetical protein